MGESAGIGAVPGAKLLTRREAAQILRICTKSLDKLIRSKAVRIRRVGRRVLIASEDLAAYLGRPAA